MAEHASSIEIPASPEVVFEYLVTAEGLTLWMGEHAVLDARAGGVFEVDIAGSPIRGTFLEVDRPHRVVVSWGVAGSEDLPPGASQVSFTLIPTDSGTRVDLLHSGLPDLRVAGHIEGWAHFLPRLSIVCRGDVAPLDTWIPLPLRSQ
ncbi:SRPBCC domain-containing protein [Leifsonia sp. YAF41]|uniref:SRPBCC family protein n=1 Tax=Leifsonia sp. YAF41 TaxID=3233086 RepID=UPI003F9B6543